MRVMHDLLGLFPFLLVQKDKIKVHHIGIRSVYMRLPALGPRFFLIFDVIGGNRGKYIKK